MSSHAKNLREEGEDPVQHVHVLGQLSGRTVLIGGAAMATSLALPLKSLASQPARGILLRVPIPERIHWIC
jgi:non-heme chloroperoxidase